MTNEIARIEHEIWLCSQGCSPQDLPWLREELKRAYAEEALDLRNTLEAGRIYKENFGDGMAQAIEMQPLVIRGQITSCGLIRGSKESAPITNWITPMGYDEYIDSNRELREMEGH